MSAREVESSAAASAAAAPTSAPIRNESSSASTAARPTSSHTGSERRRQQAGSSSYDQAEPQRYNSANIPASYEPLFGDNGGAYDSSDQSSTDRDRDNKNANAAAVAAAAAASVVLPDTCPAAYTIKWGPHQSCVRTPLDIDDAVASSVTASASGVAGKSSSRVNFLRREWQCDVRSTATSPSRKLYVLRDTGDEDTNRLLCAALDVDPAFMTAHITGQRYRPRDRPWRGGFGGNANYSACSYVFPQTLTITVSKPLPDDPPRDNESGNRLAPNAPNAQRSAFRGTLEDVNEKTRALFDASDPAVASKAPGRGPVNSLLFVPKPKMRSNPVVMFCRGSLWVSPRANVLFLDTSPSSTSLEDALLEALDGAAGDPNAGQSTSISESQLPASADILDNALSGLVYDQWLDFVDTLSASNRESNYGRVNRKLLWSMSQYLEQNLAVARVSEKRFQQRQQQQEREHRQPQDAPQFSTEKVAQFYYDDQQFANSDDWKELLSRIERIVALLPLAGRNSLSPITAGNKMRFMASDTSYTVDCIPAPDNGSVSIHSAPGTGLGGNGTSNSKGGPPPGGINDPSHRPFSQTPQGQIALSRISYMGGILLPFSIIAGVLSMSDPFGPGDRLFWVFWVMTLPITCFTLTIIYADDIRKSYIWKPMSHKSLEDAINRGEAVTASAAARLARAAEKVVDKFSADDDDSEIETNPVASAVRVVDSRGNDGRQAKVRVTTNSGPGGPTFYRLPDLLDKAESPRVSPVPEILDPLSGPGAVEKPNVHIPVAIHQARVRPRFGILAPLRRILPGGGGGGQADPPVSSSSRSQQQTSQGRFADDVETGLSQGQGQGQGQWQGETVVIDFARPNVDSGTADLFSRPPSGINVAAPGCPTILLAQSTDDLQPVAWRRQQLGWAGAFKTMVGYHLPQDA